MLESRTKLNTDYARVNTVYAREIISIPYKVPGT